MERIKKAIQKAKDSQAEAMPSNRSHWVPGKGGPREEDPGDLSSIAYQETGIRKVDLDHLEDNRILAFNKNDPNTFAFDLLRTQVLSRMQEKNWNTIAITSPTPRCGKTVTACNLAASISQQTSRTALLVDFDLRRPRVADYFGIEADVMLSDFIDGTAEIQDTFVNPGFQRLVILPNRRGYANAAEVLSSSKIRRATHDLKHRYESRIVIYDVPPLLVSDDTIAFLPQVDCVLLIVAAGLTTKSEIENCMSMIDKETLVGVVLNKVEGQRKAYY